MNLKQALARIAELESEILTLKKKGKPISEWKEPNGLSLEESLTDSREWRNVSWSGGTPPGPWEMKLRETHPNVKIPYSPYKGGTRGGRERAAKAVLDSEILTDDSPNAPAMGTYTAKKKW